MEANDIYGADVIRSRGVFEEGFCGDENCGETLFGGSGADRILEGRPRRPMSCWRVGMEWTTWEGAREATGYSVAMGMTFSTAATVTTQMTVATAQTNASTRLRPREPWTARAKSWSSSSPSPSYGSLVLGFVSHKAVTPAREQATSGRSESGYW
jgi:hypothetical protein